MLLNLTLADYKRHICSYKTEIFKTNPKIKKKNTRIPRLLKKWTKMAWGYWSATSVDRGRSPRRNTQCQGVVSNAAMPIAEVSPPATCYSPTCRSPTCRSPCQQSPCHSPCQSICQSRCQSPCQNSPVPVTQDEYSRRPSLDRQLDDSPQVTIIN